MPSYLNFTLIIWKLTQYLNKDLFFFLWPRLKVLTFINLDTKLDVIILNMNNTIMTCLALPLFRKRADFSKKICLWSYGVWKKENQYSLKEIVSCSCIIKPFFIPLQFIWSQEIMRCDPLYVFEKCYLMRKSHTVRI